MRLIDADELMEKYHKTPVWDSWVEINNAPTIDAVPVVRCKDCVMYQSSGKSGLNLGWCPVCSFVRWGDDFCSYGERKESNE